MLQTIKTVVALTITLLWLAVVTSSVRATAPPILDTDNRQTIKRSDIEVVDGDTIRSKHVTYRLMGFDTPETFQAKCPYELELGLTAAQYLDNLISNAKVLKLEIHGKDKYRRTLAVLWIDDIAVQYLMIKAEMAVPYNGRTKRINWCEREPKIPAQDINPPPSSVDIE